MELEIETFECDLTVSRECANLDTVRRDRERSGAERIAVRASVSYYTLPFAYVVLTNVVSSCVNKGEAKFS